MRYVADLVTLRSPEPGDAEHHARWFADPEVTRTLALRYPLSPDAVAQRVAEGTRPSFADRRFTVLANDTGAAVGYTALKGATPENRDAELDVVLGERSLWGRGYGTAATRATCRYGFDRVGLHRVHLWALADDARAVRAYERAGFVTEGRARDRIFKDGRWHDCLLMGLLAGELR
ncbi:MAG TPA: GNAT family protein [Frankiaceae bacterium]|nr:GNAT family protein [Frankiaceae bacterium]